MENKQQNQQEDAKMSQTGERMVSQLFDIEGAKEDVFDHLHRYARAFDFVKDKDVLDIASGEGYGSSLLSKYAKKVVGVDISQEAIDFASQKYKGENINFIQGSADDIPLSDASVDVVVSFETLEHHDKHDEMFKEIKRVLRPNGLLIISTPDRDYYRVDVPKNEHHVKEIDLSDFRSLVKRYFNNHEMLFQRYIEASIICTENTVGEFQEFQGNFTTIVRNNGLTKPNYNLCFASDHILSKQYCSIFHNYKLKLESQILDAAVGAAVTELLQSRTYRLGNAIATPLRILRNILS